MSTAPSRPDVATSVRALAVEARRRVLDRDVPGWTELLAEVGRLDDPAQRLFARKLVAEATLDAPTDDPLLLARTLLALSEGLLDALEDEPAEPVLLNLAGAACFELGATDAALELFEAAERLDPELPHVVENLEACRRAGTPFGLPPALAAARARLGGRASAVAARAQPASGLRLSLCMIVKDEEEMLPRCLAAAGAAVDEIIVVDTGSSDATVAIAEAHGARVLHHEWDGDFGAARNVSLDAATGDWVLCLDADEVLVGEDADRLRALCGRTWRDAFYLVEINHLGELGDGTASSHSALRMWRNRPHMRFDGRIHEQIAQHLPGYLPERIEQSGVRIEHFGYLGEVRAAKDKARRNIELLERQREEGAASPFLDFNLGSEHLAAGDPARARRSFAAAWDALRDDPQRARYGFVPSLGSRYVRTLRAAQDPGTDALAEEVLELFPGYTDVVLEQALLAGARGEEERCIALLERCLEMGDAPAVYSPTVGAGGSIARVQLAEVLAAVGRHDEAEAQLERTLELHPDFLGTVNPLASLLLRRGVPAHEVVGHIHDRVAEVTPSIRFVLAVALHERGAAVEAERELEGLLAVQPTNGHARVALAEALLSQGRLADAEAAAALVPDDAPAAEAAIRSELFARMAQGHPDGVAERAAAHLPAAEAGVFAAWAGVGGVPREGAAACETMLGALARIEAFTAFEQLALAVDRGTLPWRHARELLARTYLRHGFLASAADEWILVCRELPRDVDALRGLATVAERQGLPEDAAALRAEAELVAG